MTNVVPRLGDALEALKRDQWRPVSREIARAVEAEQGRGLVQAARIQARARVAGEALERVAQLSHEEERYIGWAPLGESRYKAIVDAYALYVAYEVGR